MITLPSGLLAANWRALAALAVVGLLALAVLYYRSEAAVAEVAAARAAQQTAEARRDLAEMTGAYNLLAASVARQNAAVMEWEAKAAEAAARGAKARTEAASVVDIAIRHAEALGRRMSEPAVTSCPAGEGLLVVREDWRGESR